MENTALQQLLKKYRLGECTDSERQVVEDWYRSLGKDEIVDIQGINSLEKKMWNSISTKIDFDESAGDISDYAHPRIIRWGLLRKFAAIFLVGLVLLGVHLHQISKNVVSRAIVVNREFSTIYLSDGSTVKLKSDSKLEYPERFNGNTREVNLIGEAFFDIAKDSLKPFIIHSPNLITKVLGTSFSIKAYNGDQAREVEVVSGKVMVSVKQQSGISREIILVPSQKIIYNQKSDSLITINTIDLTPIPHLIDTKLVFVEVPLYQIIETLSDLYDKQIILGNSAMNNCLITADLTGEPLEICLEILAKSVNATYTINNQVIEINGTGCQN